MSPLTWQMWCLAALLLCSAMTVDADVRESRIPNVHVLLAMVTGLLLNTLGPDNGAEGMLSDFPGALGLFKSLAGLSLGMLLLLPLYAIGVMGAGDVKWMGALGSFVGPHELLGLLLAVFLAGGVLSVVRMLQKGHALAVLRSTGQTLGQWLAWGKPVPVSRSVDRMPYALAFAGGCLMYAYARFHGVNAPSVF
jgi:prepilin peptidase CpaA